MEERGLDYFDNIPLGFRVGDRYGKNTTTTTLFSESEEENIQVINAFVNLTQRNPITGFTVLLVVQEYDRITGMYERRFSMTSVVPRDPVGRDV